MLMIEEQKVAESYKQAVRSLSELANTKVMVENPSSAATTVSTVYLTHTHFITLKGFLRFPLLLSFRDQNDQFETL